MLDPVKQASSGKYQASVHVNKSSQTEAVSRRKVFRSRKGSSNRQTLGFSPPTKWGLIMINNDSLPKWGHFVCSSHFQRCVWGFWLGVGGQGSEAWEIGLTKTDVCFCKVNFGHKVNKQMKEKSWSIRIVCSVVSLPGTDGRIQVIKNKKSFSSRCDWIRTSWLLFIYQICAVLQLILLYNIKAGAHKWKILDSWLNYDQILANTVPTVTLIVSGWRLEKHFQSQTLNLCCSLLVFVNVSVQLYHHKFSKIRWKNFHFT